MANSEVRDAAWWEKQTQNNLDSTQRDALNASLSGAVQVQPDAAAKQQVLAQGAGVPSQTAAEFPADTKRLFALNQAQALDLIAKTPALAHFLTIQKNAEVAHDDIPALAKTEQGIQDAAATAYVSPHADETLGDSVSRFADSAFRGYAGVGAGIAKAVGVLATAPWAAYDRVFDTQTADTRFDAWVKPWADRVELAKPQGEDVASKLGAGIGAALGTIPYAILTGGGSTAAAGMTEAGLPLTTAQFMGQAAGQGAKAMAVPAFSAGVGAMDEVYGSGKSMGQAVNAGVANAIATMAQGAVPVSMTGNIATRILSGGAIGGLTGEVIGRQGTNLLMPEDMQRERDLASATTDVLLGGLMGAVPHKHGEFVRDLRNATTEAAKVWQDADRAATAEKHIDATLNTITEESLLAKREGAREQFNQLVQDMAEKSGGDRLYIDAEVFAKMLDEHGVDQEELHNLMPSAAEQLRTELPSGGQIAIPFGDYFSGLAESKLGQALKPHLRVDPDGVTFSEARKAVDTHIESLRTIAPEAAAKVERAQAWDDSVRQVREAVLPEIESTGRYSKDYNARFADLATTLYSVVADKLGVLPHEAHARFKFSMSADRPTVAMDRLAQGGWLGRTLGALKGAFGGAAGDAHPTLVAAREANTFKGQHPSAGRMVGYTQPKGTPAENIFSNFSGEFEKKPEGWRDRSGEGRTWDQAKQEWLGTFKAKLFERFDSVPRSGKPAVVDAGFSNASVWYDTASGVTAVEFKKDGRRIAAARIHRGMVDTVVADIPGVGSDILRFLDDNNLANVYEVPDRSPGYVNALKRYATEQHRLYQPNVAQEGPRGEISFDPSRDPIIHLFDAANESTPVHELAHFFLNVYGELSAHPDAPEGIRRDMEIFAKWAGAENAAAWNKMDLTGQTAGHEKFAQTFEAYLLTGKAPVPELAGLFSKFKAFLTQVYKSIRGQLPLADLSKDIVGVLDRMVAAEDAIATAESYRGMVNMLDAKPEGWSEDKWAEHVAAQDAATTSAQDALASRSVRDMQWLSNAKLAAIKAMQAKHDTLRSQVRVRARREIMATKEYQAWAWLTRKIDAASQLPKVSNAPGVALDPTKDPLLHAIAKLGGIKAESAMKQLGVHADDIKGTRSPVFGKPLWRRTGGHSADAMAERLGELGYLLPDEFGRFDLNDLAESLDRSVRGDDVFSVAKDYSERRGSDMVDFDPLGAGRIDLTDLRQLDLPEHVVEKLIERGMTSQTKTGKVGEGWPPEFVAGRFGFDDAIAMAHELAGVEPPKEAVENLTDRYMMEQHAELATPSAIAKAADAAVYNEHRIRLFAAELKAVEAGVGSERRIAKAAMQVAEETLSDKRVRDIRPDVYAAAASREGKKAKDAYRKLRAPDTARRTASTKAEAEAAKAGASAVEVQALGMKAGEEAAKVAEARAKEKGEGTPTELAIKAKRAQILQSAMAKTAMAMREEAKAAVVSLKEMARVAASGRLGAAHGDAMRTLLSKYNLHDMSGAEADRQIGLRGWVDHLLASGDPVTVMPALQGLLSKAGARRFKQAIESRSADGGLVYADDAAQLRALADVLDGEPSIPYVNMTMAELRGLLATAENITAANRRDNELSSVSEKATYEGTRDALRESAETFGSDKDKARREASATKDKTIARMRSLGHGGIKMSTRALLADGGKWGGAWVSSIIIPASQRASRETAMKLAATESLRKALESAMASIPKKEQHLAGRRVDGLPESIRLTWEERFSMLLNLGNEGNMQRLMDGGIAGTELKSLTPAQIMAVVKTLDADTIRAAQAVWDHFETYRPEIARLERKYSGKEPEWTVPRQITLTAADGTEVTLKGGHYPAKYDTLGNIKADYTAEADTSAAAAHAARFAATTQQTFTKARADTVKGQAIVLGMRPLYSGVEEIIHDICWREWVKDQNKLLKSQSIKEVLYHKFGAEFHHEWRQWVSDIAAGNTGASAALDPFANLVRAKVSSAGLAFNVFSALFQGFGVVQSARIVGGKWFWEGVTDFAARRGEAVREMKEKSDFMNHRTVTAWRDLLALKNKIGGETEAASWFNRNKYLPLLMCQQAVDTPTWWGAYRRAVAEGHIEYHPDGKLDDSKAVALADQAVKMSQGGGEAVDLSRWERDSGSAHQLFTLFYSFMNTQLNVQYLTAKDKGMSKGAKAAWIIGIGALTPALMDVAKSALTPGQGDDKDIGEYVRDGVVSGAENTLGLFPYLREFSVAARALVGSSSRGYQGPSGLRVAADAYLAAKQTHQAIVGGEFDTAFRKAIINLLGDMTGMPSSQLNRSWTGAEALNDGKTENPAALLLGHQEPKH